MEQVFWQELNEELQKGIAKKGHPFRYMTLATVGLDDVARLRTVVLRKLTENLDLTIYTDKRSKKVTHIKENNKVSLLLYHPKKLVQVKIEGKAKIIEDAGILKKYWSGIQPNSRKDYITKNAPGSVIKNPDLVNYKDDEHHFCIIEIEPFKIEYLQLKRPNHLRVRFSKNKDNWEGDFLVP